MSTIQNIQRLEKRLERQDERLGHIERFKKSLIRNSYLAKASHSGEYSTFEHLDANDKLMAASAADFDWYNDMDERIKKLERGGENAAQDEGEQALTQLVGTLKTGDDILSKAVNSPEVNTVNMGVINSHVTSGDLPEARRVLLDSLSAPTIAKAADPMSAAMNAVGTDTETDAGEVREAVVRLEQSMATILERLDRLEARAPVRAAPRATPAATVAKATQQRQTRSRTPEELLELLTLIKSPTRVGALSAQIQSGDPLQIAQAERTLLAAEREHLAQNGQQGLRGASQ